MSEIPRHIFRANDIRGIADIDLKDSVVRSIAGSFGKFLTEREVKSVGIGYDVRLTSPRIFKIYKEELLKFPLEVFDLGMVPSPVAYFVNHYYEEIEAVSIVTASHNPSEYNGIKFCVRGNSMTQDCIMELYRLSTNYTSPVTGKSAINQINAKQSYIDYLAKSFEGTNDFKVAIDTANATAGLIVPDLLDRIGQDYVIINEELDGTFPNHHPDPTIASNMQQLSDLVLSTGASVGFGFDGDSDRIGVIDDKGRFISGDVLTALFAKDILSRNSGPVVIEVKSSQLLIDTITKSGGSVEMSKVGHSFIKKRIKESGALLAGELSGHMFFCDEYFGYDDAFYCMLRMIRLLKERGVNLSQLIDEFPSYYNTPEIHLVFNDDQSKFEMFNTIQELFKEADHVNRIDGIRISYEDGWGLIRPSNTQTVIVTRYEGKTKSALSRIKNEIESQIFRVFQGEIRSM